MTFVTRCMFAAWLLTGPAFAGQESWPTESFVQGPERPFSPDDLVFHRDQLSHFYDVPGEFGWFLEGADYGFSKLSIITAETRPGGGPPLHTHATEEAHVIAAGGRYRVLIGTEVHDVVGPAIVRIPANTPHTFMNTGDEILSITGILPGPRIDYTELGPNPLLDAATPVAASAADRPGAAGED